MYRYSMLNVCILNTYASISSEHGMHEDSHQPGVNNCQKFGP